MDYHIQIEAASLDVLAQPTPGVGLLHRTTEALGRPEILAPNVDVGLVASNGKGSDDHAFQEHMWVALQDVSIFEGPRLPLVGVDYEVLGLWTGLRDKGPLPRCWKPSSPQAAEVCPGDLVNDLRRGHGRKRFFGRNVTFVGDVRIPPRALWVFKPRREHGAIGRDKGLPLVARA